MVERRCIIDYLRNSGVPIWTTHLRPAERNFRISLSDISFRGASNIHALGGYLGVSVRQYLYVKHRRRLYHPYLPCAIEYGGRDKKNNKHKSFFPLEILEVRINTVCPILQQIMMLH